SPGRLPRWCLFKIQDQSIFSRIHLRKSVLWIDVARSTTDLVQQSPVDPIVDGKTARRGERAPRNDMRGRHPIGSFM
ncbi:hypothetical protein, partial [Bradyrhizobium sp.]|uniref:hypothetical protein n=1 Tax=Bradyrhizobium sp. TaxID=376 RepID=UPI003C1E5793